MTLKSVLKEREKKRGVLRHCAIEEAKRLTALLRERFEFDSIYICGSILSDRFSLRSDIDMVIKGLKMEDFFKAYAFLIKEGRYKVDLKPFEDLTEDFKKKILAGGLKIG